MFSFFTNDLRRNLIKVICLTLGLALGIVIVAKICVETSRDADLPDVDRLYIVTESCVQNGEYLEHKQCPGAIAPGIKAYCPGVEAATRYTRVSGPADIRLADGRRFETEGILLADSAYFDIFGRPVIEGNPREVLEVRDMCVIPRSLADKIGEDAVGSVITCPDLSPDYKVTVGGVYEDYPVNSTIESAVLLSLPSIGNFAVDGRDNWMGNDRYAGFVRLAPGVTPESLQPAIDRMLADHVDSEGLEAFHLQMHLRSFRDVYSSRSDVRTMVWVLSLLVVVLLMSAGLNYVLVTIGQLGRRSREMAVRKCYGTSDAAIFGRMVGEGAFFLAVSMGLAVLFAFCFADQCRTLLGNTPAQLFSVGRVWVVEGLVCLGLLIVTGAIPAWVYCRTPVAHAFRGGSRGGRVWKLSLLAVQFFASGMLLCLLSLVGRQYALLADTDLGFDYQNVGKAYIGSLPQQQRRALVDELRRLGSVESVSTAYEDFLARGSGNNVWLGNNSLNNINVADRYFVNPGIVETMGMRLVEGEDFDADADSVTAEVIVEKSFADVLRKLGLETDRLVGQHFCITEHEAIEGHNEFVIRGVVENMRRGGFRAEDADSRAGVFFPSCDVQDNLYVLFYQISPEALSEAQSVIGRHTSEVGIFITPYREDVRARTQDVRNFGFAVVIVGVVILVVALIGLVGYTADEVRRRAREIAVRKVNGTSAAAIVRLFCRDVLVVAIPSVILGAVAAAVVGRRWLAQFTDRVSLSWPVMTLCVLALLILLTAIVSANTARIARSNPIDHLREE